MTGCVCHFQRRTDGVGELAQVEQGWACSSPMKIGDDSEIASTWNHFNCLTHDHQSRSLATDPCHHILPVYHPWWGTLVSLTIISFRVSVTACPILTIVVMPQPKRNCVAGSFMPRPSTHSKRTPFVCFVDNDVLT